MRLLDQFECSIPVAIDSVERLSCDSVLALNLPVLFP
jgi:hypothetical protein